MPGFTRNNYAKQSLGSLARFLLLYIASQQEKAHTCGLMSYNFTNNVSTCTRIIS